MMGALALLACQPDPPAPPNWCAASGKALGTTWNLTWQAPSCEVAVQERATAVLAEVDAGMSTWRDDSELSKVRQGGRHQVSADTFVVIDAALDLAARTGGAFDPTVQPLMEVWGFHSKDRKAAPTPEALEAARSQVGWERVKLSPGDLVDAGGTALDLSAIAKGHAVDRVFQGVSALGIGDLMVEIGGEVRVGGNGPKGAWALGVDAPKQGSTPGEELVAVLELHNLALATSGNYRNLVEVDGARVHHTMDPRTGKPAVSDVASVSVLAPSCRAADGLATAVMVLGTEKGLALIEGTPDTEVLILRAKGEGWTQIQSSGLAAFLR